MRAQIWENEIRLFDKARECLPDNVHVWVELLRAQLEAGQVREAWQSLNEIRRLRSSQPGGDLGDVELALCGILLKSGHPKEAEEMARVALQRHPGTAALWGNLGEALLRQGRPEEARSALEQGTKLEPQQSEFWASLAEAQLVLGQRDEGLASLERAIQGPRPSSRACFNLGVLLERQNPRQAAVHFRTYLGLEPQASDAHQVRQRIARLDAIAGP